jgi:hypothetical protein
MYLYNPSFFSPLKKGLIHKVKHYSNDRRLRTCISYGICFNVGNYIILIGGRSMQEDRIFPGFGFGRPGFGFGRPGFGFGFGWPFFGGLLGGLVGSTIFSPFYGYPFGPYSYGPYPYGPFPYGGFW